MILHSSITGGLLLAAVLLLAIPLAPQSAAAEKSGCLRAAEEWIDKLEETDGQEILRRHADSVCLFSGQWMKKSRQVAERPRRQRMCTDLVLLWSHKECNYFRDLINPDAYEPCKAWSRLLYKQCMNNAVSWFL